jgi:hypothetical protein
MKKSFQRTEFILYAYHKKLKQIIFRKKGKGKAEKSMKNIF